MYISQHEQVGETECKRNDKKCACNALSLIINSISFIFIMVRYIGVSTVSRFYTYNVLWPLCIHRAVQPPHSSPKR